MKSYTIRSKLMAFMAVILLLMIFTTILLYAINYRVVKREITDFSNAAVSQINSQLDTYLNESADLIKIFSYNENVRNYLANTELPHRYEEFSHLNSLYLTVKSIKPNLTDLILLDASGGFLSLGGLVYNQSNLYAGIFDNDSLNLSAIRNISPKYQVRTDGQNNLLVSSPVYAFDDSNTRVLVGHIAFLLDLRPIITLMDSLRITKSAEMLLFDADLNYVTGTTDEEQWLQAVADPVNTGQLKQINGKEYLYLHDRLGKTEFIVICFVPQSEIYFYGGFMIKNGALLILINGIVIVLISYSINKSVALPIRLLLGTIEKIQEGNLNERVRSSDRSEIGNLAKEFDRMMDKVKALTATIVLNQSRMYELQIKKNEMESIALQNQINPHFLHNTLACVQGIAIHNRQHEIASIAKGLGKIYNYILRSPEVVTVEQEIGIVGHYINIIKIRIGDRLRTDIDIDPSLLKKPIMKLLLQPLIENAIEHGISDRIGGGTVRLWGKKTDVGAQFIISDDGGGMSGEVLSGIRQMLAQTKPEQDTDYRTHFGLYNIIARLQLTYEDRFSFTCESSMELGTVITLNIPLNEEKARERL